MQLTHQCKRCHERQPAGTVQCARCAGPCAPDPLVGQLVGGRRIVDWVGGGGMGVVYRAQRDGLNRLEVVKLLAGAAAPAEVRLFEEEARIVSGLRSVHTVQVFDYGVEATVGTGLRYIVMEYVPGGTLREAFRAAGDRLEPTRAARIALQICDSLAEAHAQGIIHRDLKPENVMIERRRGDDFARVLDFGIALVVGETRTASGILRGTPAYMSPEQARGRSDLDERSDLYALGVMLYELVSGTNPFHVPAAADGKVNPIVILERQNRIVPAPLRGVPEALATLVSSLLEKDPARRPRSADEVADRLDDLLREEERRALQADVERALRARAEEIERTHAERLAALQRSTRDAEAAATRAQAEAASCERAAEQARGRLEAETARHAEVARAVADLESARDAMRRELRLTWRGSALVAACLTAAGVALGVGLGALVAGRAPAPAVAADRPPAAPGPSDDDARPPRSNDDGVERPAAPPTEGVAAPATGARAPDRPAPRDVVGLRVPGRSGTVPAYLRPDGLLLGAAVETDTLAERGQDRLRLKEGDVLARCDDRPMRGADALVRCAESALARAAPGQRPVVRLELGGATARVLRVEVFPP